MSYALVFKMIIKSFAPPEKVSGSLPALSHMIKLIRRSSYGNLTAPSSIQVDGSIWISVKCACIGSSLSYSTAEQGTDSRILQKKKCKDQGGNDPEFSL